jgi:hypothetical protein
MWAVRKHYYAMIQLLVQRGADCGSFLEFIRLYLVLFSFLVLKKDLCGHYFILHVSDFSRAILYWLCVCSFARC